MTKITLKGRKVYGGSVEGEALVTKDALGGYGGFDPYTGIVVDQTHEWLDKSISGKILVFKTGRGSSGWTIAHQALRFTGNSPAAYIVKEINPQVALGAVVGHVPAMTDFDKDPTELISTGDWVIVNADQGIVEIMKK